jgi:surfeit locus 1 family protein
LLQLDTPIANANANATQDKLQRRWAQPNYGSEKNYGYMVQWWALSALITLLYVWFQLVSPNSKSKNKAKQN